MRQKRRNKCANCVTTFATNQQSSLIGNQLATTSERTSGRATLLLAWRRSLPVGLFVSAGQLGSLATAAICRLNKWLQLIEPESGEIRACGLARRRRLGRCHPVGLQQVSMRKRPLAGCSWSEDWNNCKPIALLLLLLLLQVCEISQPFCSPIFFTLPESSILSSRSKARPPIDWPIERHFCPDLFLLSSARTDTRKSERTKEQQRNLTQLESSILCARLAAGHLVPEEECATLSPSARRSDDGRDLALGAQPELHRSGLAEFNLDEPAGWRLIESSELHSLARSEQQTQTNACKTCAF